MKKLFFLFVVLILTGSFAMADDVGLTVGFEISFLDFNDTWTQRYMMPSVAYEKALLDESLELSAGLGIPMCVNPNVWLGFDLDLKAAYNLKLGSASTLSFILGNKNFFPAVAKNDNYQAYSTIFEERLADITGKIIPGIGFKQGIGDAGSLFLQADIPLIYNAVPGVDLAVGLDFALGFKSSIGLGFQGTVYNLFSNGYGESSYFEYVELIPCYESEIIYAEILFGLPTYKNGFDLEGLKIRPEVQIKIPPAKSLMVFLALPIFGIGSDNGVGVGMTVGVKYSF